MILLKADRPIFHMGHSFDEMNEDKEDEYHTEIKRNNSNQTLLDENIPLVKSTSSK